MNESKEKLVEAIRGYDGPPIRIMEVCGTHTHENFRLGIRSILPPQIDLISGPGCPVCVTPAGFIDKAVWLLERGVSVCTFGDLVRVPGSATSLSGARAGASGKIKIVYSPLDAEKYAEENPARQVVFLSVGFETTTPASCLAVKHACDAGLKNFSLLVANKTMPHAYAALKGSADVFLYPGHVHAITGTSICRKLLSDGISGVVAGFTAHELLTAFAIILEKYREGKPFFVNAYPRVVRDEGNPAGILLIEKFMEPCDAVWRGLGNIGGSGLKLRDEYAGFDAEKKFDIPKMSGRDNPACRCGDVLRGTCKSTDCSLFGSVCTPQNPVGACMVSNEGACSAYYQYGGTL